MEPLICSNTACTGYVDPDVVCLTCGYPECPECMYPPNCIHFMQQSLQENHPVVKRLKRDTYDSEDIYMRHSIIGCLTCEREYCIKCYEAFAIRFSGVDFTPSLAYKYTPSIRNAALLLYCYNKTRHCLEKVPKALLKRIISFL